MDNNLSKIDYPGELTLEALATIDTYIKQCCSVNATAHKLRKGYVQVRRFLRQPYVRELFQLKLMEKGVTPDKVASVIKDGIEATNGIYYEGNKVADEPNWPARQKFAQLAAEIYEVLKYAAKTDVNINQSHTSVVVFRNPEAIKENADNSRITEKQDAQLQAR